MGSIFRRAREVLALLLSSAASWSAAAQTACPEGAPRLIVYHAGSLSTAFAAVEKVYTQQTGVCVVDVAAGSVDAARRVSAGGEACDIYASADDKVIELMLEPAGFADYTITFAQGAMVLAYTTASRNAATIAAPGGVFVPPGAVPDAAGNWYQQLTQGGVVIGGSNPFLDPSGYRSDLIFQLAELNYGVPNLYNTLLARYTLTRPSDALGSQFDYQFTYEHSALAAYQRSPETYRYLRLPEAVGLSSPELNRRYDDASIALPGLHAERGARVVRIPGSRVAWGLTVLRNAPNKANAIEFLKLLLGPQGVALQRASGPEPISPALVSYEDWHDLPAALRPLVRPQQRAQH